MPAVPNVEMKIANAMTFPPSGPRIRAMASEATFITEHYWGYTAQRDGSTVEYQVEHPPWRVWDVAEHHFECDSAALYGPHFAPALQREPSSCFVAVGSDIVVRHGRKL